MKISIIGAGNVGGTTAMRLAQEGLGDIFLIDIAPGLAKGKAFDLNDARPILKSNYSVSGSNNLQDVKDSDIIVVTAGLARKPSMTREDLANKNAAILKDIGLIIKKEAAEAIIIAVTNPLDLMVNFLFKTADFKPNALFGMGVSLDASRFANLIAEELKLSSIDVDACVIGIHGQGMIPMPRFTSIKGIGLEEFLTQDKIELLAKRTVERGAEIVSLLGSGSAYYAPSAAIASLVRIIIKDEKRTVPVCAYLNGEYGLADVCIGVPCRLGRSGIEEIIELDLTKEEKEKLISSAENLRAQYKNITV